MDENLDNVIAVFELIFDLGVIGSLFAYGTISDSGLSFGFAIVYLILFFRFPDNPRRNTCLIR